VSKNAGKVVKFCCTFDKLIDKYKKEKANSLNRPLKKRERSPPKQDESKQIMLALTPNQQGKSPHVSHWGLSVQPPTHPMWGPYGVWVPYPPWRL
jgi:hypothetical protein